MSLYSQNDSIPFPSLNLPFDVSKRSLDPEPRLIDGINSYITLGGAIEKRLGLTRLNSATDNTTAEQCYKLWLYETSNGKIYIMGSFIYDAGGGLSDYRMKYLNLDDTTPAWTSLGGYRDLDEASRVHECTSYRGLFYIRYPINNLSTPKYGSVIFDGNPSTPLVKPWGIPKPTQPVRIKGNVTYLSSAIGTVNTVLTVPSTTGFPTSYPFLLYIGQEEVNCTGSTSNSFTVQRAANGTKAEAYDAKTKIYYKNFNVSTHDIDVSFYWKYAYCWKSITDHYSSSTPEEFNPDLMPSSTGRFKNKRPIIIVRGHADTTNFPKIVIFRTANGGGYFFKLDEITNTGDVDIEYEDKYEGSGPSGTTYEDPKPDKRLTDPGPDTTSNDPPPMSILPDQFNGNISKPSTRLVTYASRIWFAIENILWYSGGDETNIGKPEESYDTKILGGNYFTFSKPIRTIEATQDGLYILMDDETHVIRGVTKNTFVPNLLFPFVGTIPNQSQPITKIFNGVAWITQDYKVVINRSNSRELEVISDSLGKEFKSDVSQGQIINLTYRNNLTEEVLIISSMTPNTPYTGIQYVFDFKKYNLLGIPFWYTPWDVRATALVNGRLSGTRKTEDLIWYHSKGLIGGSVKGTILFSDPFNIVGYDENYNDTTGVLEHRAFDFYITTNLLIPPIGNHINSLVSPEIYTTFKQLIVEMLDYGYTPKQQISVYIYKDQIGGTPTLLLFSGQTFVGQDTIGYTTFMFDVNEACRRIGFKISLLASENKLTIENIIPTWVWGTQTSD